MHLLKVLYNMIVKCSRSCDIVCLLITHESQIEIRKSKGTLQCLERKH